MREEILKNVAQPPKLFLAPQAPALVNVAVHIFLMLFLMLIFGPFMIIYVLCSSVIFHMILIFFGKKEPHITNFVLAYMKSPKKSNNIVKERGNKFLP